MRKVLRPYQVELKRKIYEAWQAGHKNVLAVMDTGLGKCLGRDTPVLMYDGSIKAVQDIKSGDSLMGPDSKPRIVMSTCRGESEMFDIIPVKGDRWRCNDVHVLTLKHTSHDGIIDIALNEYLNKSSRFKHLFKQFRVGIEFESKPVPFDPYLVGLYLAEGSYRDAHITTPEMEIVEFLASWCRQNEMKMNIGNGRNCAEIGFSDVKPKWYKNKIRSLARYCTNKNDRWIPREFLVNDRATRLQVLAGLLDGDGYMFAGQFEIVTKYPSLNRDILFLARSLGFSAYSKKKKATIKSTGFSGIYDRVTIGGDINQIPNKVHRKKSPPRKQIKSVLKTGFTIEPAGFGEYFGFELNEDGRFLLGDFTVTHNTRSFCAIAYEMGIAGLEKRPTAILVHRKELVQQISLTLAEEEIVHNIIAPRPVISGIVAAHRRVLKKQYYDYNAPITVVSVDTLNARILKHKRWAENIRLWITDEAAHLLKNNKWGRAVEYFPNAIGLGVTATPQRLDKRGLGRHADGVFDTMVLGPNSRWGIDNGFLCKYKIAIPQSDYQNYLRKASDGSDYSKDAMIEASGKSHIVGDVVINYQKFADGKQAILFATDINTATKMEAQFKAAGVKAKLLTGETEDKERLDALLDFQNKVTQVLLNVDLFDEGLDVPGIECVIMARPTMSVSKYKQMCIDQETEILTKRGWLNHTTIENSDLVAAFNIENNEIEWCKIQELIKRPRHRDESMFSLASPHIDFRVTSHHDMIAKSRSKTTKNWQKETIDETSERQHCFHVPVNGIENVKDAQLTDDEIKFIGWFLTDGGFGSRGTVVIAQCSNRKKHLAHIRKTLRSCNFKFGEYVNKRTGSLSKYDPMILFSISEQRPKKKFKSWRNQKLKGWRHLAPWLDKKIPEIYDSLSERQIEILINTMNMGDGNQFKTVSWIPRTMFITMGDNKLMAERIQSLLVRRGYRCNLSEEDRSHLVNRKNCWSLRIKKIPTSSISGTDDKDGCLKGKKSYVRSRIKKETEFKKEIVWCVRNRLGTIVTRRNGKVIITGNCGRGLRPAPNKPYMILIDHVGNVTNHGLPCDKRRWTLDRIVKKRDKTNFIRICSNTDCNSPYDRTLSECPWCGTEAIPSRSGGGGRIPPKQVDGDLYLIDPETIRQLEKQAQLDDPLIVQRRVGTKAGVAAGIKAMRDQVKRIETQKELVNKIAYWAGIRRQAGYTDRQLHKLFYLQHEKTISQALAEPKAEMLATMEKVIDDSKH